MDTVQMRAPPPPPTSSKPATPKYRSPGTPSNPSPKFELKTDEASGWVEQPAVKYLIRRNCVISLNSAFRDPHSALARVSYAGGYVLPGTTPAPGQTPLPDDLEQAAVEQIAFWFINREKLGLKTSWPSGAEYRGFATQDLLPSVSAVLARYKRISL